MSKRFGYYTDNPCSELMQQFSRLPLKMNGKTGGLWSRITVVQKPLLAELKESLKGDCHDWYSGYPKVMSSAKRLLHTRYRVNDLDRTVKFYKDVLGLSEVRRSKSPRGSELVFMKAPGSEELIELCCFPESGPVHVQPDLTHLAFEVDSLDEFGKRLQSLGLKFSDGPHMKQDGGGIAFIDAPEGYEIELIQMARSGPGY